MAKVWVRAKSIVRIDENGKQKTCFPGDWCQMGRHQANEHLSRDQVEILKPDVLQTVQSLTDCTILMRREDSVRHSLLAAKYPAVPILNFEKFPEKPGRFLIWDTKVNLDEKLILTGFNLLSKWQMAVPLLSYSVLAQDVGTEEERAETKAIIPDLRVPIYECRVIFARQCREVQQLFELWNGGGQLAFLTALYQSKPVINALPPVWILK